MIFIVKVEHKRCIVILSLEKERKTNIWCKIDGFKQNFVFKSEIIIDIKSSGGRRPRERSHFITCN